MLVAELKKLLAALTDVEEPAIGAAVKGNDPVIDTAMEIRDRISAFLQQSPDESFGFPTRVGNS